VWAVWTTIGWVLLSVPLGICSAALLRHCATGLAEPIHVAARIEPPLGPVEPARRVRSSEEACLAPIFAFRGGQAVKSAAAPFLKERRFFAETAAAPCLNLAWCEVPGSWPRCSWVLRFVC
jgi:hypothetical protein